MKVRNRLLNFEDKIIYQDDDYFLFSLDSVLLANFVTIRLTDKKIIDLCSGNAPIPMLLSFRTKARIFGVELQEYIYKLGYDSIYENGIDKQIKFLNSDVKELDKEFEKGYFDVVTCNPPYFKYKDDSLINEKMEKAIARHEVKIKLEDVIRIGSYLLRNGGTFSLVHRPSRLIEIIDLMKKYNLEPKKMQLVYSKKGQDANMLLIEGVKKGKIGLKILAPLVVHKDNGEYVDEVRKMFGIVEEKESVNDNVAEKL